ncbi:MAG: glycosyltransferase family 2 protein [Mycobacteriales bacterium]
MIRVSVVVPVYNPGRSLRRCVESLLAQSLPAESTELIFVDDGSTDRSGRRLDKLASQHPHVTVIHEANSGWAGRPRNVGMQAATGEFVQFVDQDDMLGPEALERLADYGAKHGADIVLGKVTSDFRRVPAELYRENIPCCTVRDAPLIRTLTPHKMFRRDFLIDKKLRFPEGPRRLEDQLFLVQAYFATEAVAILSDYPCYFFLRRNDNRHSAKLFYEPADYYRNLREVLDVIAASTDAGSYRDGLHEKFLNTMLRKVSAAAKPGREERLAAFLKEIKAVVGEYFGPGVADRQPILRRQLAAATLNKPKKIRRLNRRYDRLAARIHSLVATPSGVGRWTITVSASLSFRDNSPVRLRPEGEHWRIDERLQVKGIAVRPDSAAELLADALGDVVLRSADTGVEWLGPTVFAASLEPTPDDDGHHLVVSGSVALDAETFAAGAALTPGTWSLAVRIRALGIGRTAQVVRRPGIEVVRPAAKAADGPRLGFRRHDQLTLKV